MSARKRPAGVIAGVTLGLVVQQSAFQIWKAEMPGLWWPLAQFSAVHMLIGARAGRAIGYALRWGKSGEAQL